MSKNPFEDSLFDSRRRKRPYSTPLLSHPDAVASTPGSPTRYHPMPFADESDEYNTSSALRRSPRVAFGDRSAYSPERNSSPGRFSTNLNTTPKAEWMRLESPKHDRNSSITIDDYRDNIDTSGFSNGIPQLPPQQDYLSGSPLRSGSPNDIEMLQHPQPAFNSDIFPPSHEDDENIYWNPDASESRMTGSTSTVYKDERFSTLETLQNNNLYNGDEYGYEYEEGNIGEKIPNLQINESSSGSSINQTLDKRVHAAPKNAQPRRHKSMSRKQVKLVHGNLILDCPVPTKLSSFLPRRDDDEFLYMRYTAVTCDADDFSQNGFTLRSAIYEREIQLCICITMYNEDERSFARTMHGVMKNVAYLVSRNKSRVWGKDGWKKVQVVIVSDGRAKIAPGVLEVLAAMGIYQDGIAKSFVNSKEVQAHLFEYTTQVSINEELKFEGAEKGLVPVQVLFCLKEKNAKKINSHRWLFNGLCPPLNPNVCILLDVGTKPDHAAMYNLWKAFDNDSNVAGACGEIKAIKGKNWKYLLNPLVATQNFEYKMSNILDKPLESVFGYISVLPGALSAYRYRALTNHEDGTGPLEAYFRGEKLEGPDTTVFTANMYLAEDRILCWELISKKKEKWVLKYVRNATGETDVPDSIPEFISQRRRWLNGALFAAVYSLMNCGKIWKTDHSYARKIFLNIEFFYQFIQLLFSVFSLGNFYLTFYFIAGSISGDDDNVIPHRGGFWLFTIAKYLLLCDLASIFIISMGNRPQGAKHLFVTTMIILVIVFLYATCVGFYFVIKTLKQKGNGSELGDNVFTNIVISMLSTYGIYIIMSFLYMDPWHIFTCAPQYFMLIPFYVCTLQIYAFCNTHDVSWGTKGDNDPKANLGSAIVKNHLGKDIVEVEIPSEQLDIDSGYEEVLCNLRDRRANTAKPEESTEQSAEDYYRDIRTRVVLGWLIANMLLVMIITQIYEPYSTSSNVYLKFILWSVAVLAAFRAIGSSLYLIQLGIRYIVEGKYKFFRNKNHDHRKSFVGGLLHRNN